MLELLDDSNCAIFVMILFLNSVSNCPIFQDGCKNAVPAGASLPVTATITCHCHSSASHWSVWPLLPSHWSPGSAHKISGKLAKVTTGVTEIADLCVTTPSLNINRFRIKSATASLYTVTGDCLSDHNGVWSFSSA